MQNLRKYLVLAVISLVSVGEALAIEEPAFHLIAQFNDIEIRQYPPLIVAETIVVGDMATASNAGFRLIANYIFGNNKSVDGVADQPSQKIAMTAPVTVERVNLTEQWRVQFVMPRAYTLSRLPHPVNEAVILREVPEKRYAVLGFDWFAGEEKAEEKAREL
ncbi:MAG: SOUL family heme-binding protein, partial [Nitrospiraceae bacterium]